MAAAGFLNFIVKTAATFATSGDSAWECYTEEAVSHMEKIAKHRLADTATAHTADAEQGLATVGVGILSDRKGRDAARTVFSTSSTFGPSVGSTKTNVMFYPSSDDAATASSVTVDAIAGLVLKEFESYVHVCAEMAHGGRSATRPQLRI